MELRDLIKKYHTSNDKNEKAELKTILLDKKRELDLPEAFDIVIRAHYEAYCFSGVKSSLEKMLRFVPE